MPSTAPPSLCPPHKRSRGTPPLFSVVPLRAYGHLVVVVLSNSSRTPICEAPDSVLSERFGPQLKRGTTCNQFSTSFHDASVSDPCMAVSHSCIKSTTNEAFPKSDRCFASVMLVGVPARAAQAALMLDCVACPGSEFLSILNAQSCRSFHVGQYLFVWSFQCIYICLASA